MNILHRLNRIGRFHYFLRRFHTNTPAAWASFTGTAESGVSTSSFLFGGFKPSRWQYGHPEQSRLLPFGGVTAGPRGLGVRCALSSAEAKCNPSSAVMKVNSMGDVNERTDVLTGYSDDPSSTVKKVISIRGMSDRAEILRGSFDRAFHEPSSTVKKVNSIGDVSDRAEVLRSSFDRAFDDPSSTVKKVSSIGDVSDRADVLTGSFENGATSSSSSGFGISFQDNYYGVSERQKVNRTSLSNESTGADAVQRLKHGFIKFQEERILNDSDLVLKLAKGQQPKVMVIACADSRVCPTMLMGSNPGEVFTVRNVANLVPPCEKANVGFHGTSAALEFAVRVLKVEHIIVKGHRDCGGIAALMSRKTNEIGDDFIGQWMSCALQAREHTLAQMEGRSFQDQCRFCEQEAINGSLANLLTFPWIKESFEAGKLRLHGWYYDFVEGELTSWEVQRPTVEKSLQPSPVAIVVHIGKLDSEDVHK